jgi:hypothetical protein
LRDSQLEMTTGLTRKVNVNNGKSNIQH